MRLLLYAATLVTLNGQWGSPHADDSAHPRAHPPQLLARVFLKTPCAPTCPAGRPIDLKAFLSGLAPGVEYAVVYHVQVRRPSGAPPCPSVRRAWAVH